ncbi:MAG TPA: tetratricopeptide repeat protein [Candidatus Sulfotelmatobacter sp.]|nr:tetratricopeptide repeat protein [Candidatus Sulfotelmatobacter sp.]
MRSAILFAIPLALFCAGSSAAQQPGENPEPSTPSQSAPSAEAPITPRATAELRADVLMARKEYADAANAYVQILNSEPKNAEIANKIGIAYQQLGELNKSERYYKKSIKADKSFASPLNNLGTVEYEKKHFGKSISLYQKALGLRTDMATVYSNLGYAYFGNKEYPQAMDAFGKALALDPAIFDRKGSGGTIVQQRTTTDPGLFYFFVAKSFALAGDVEHAAHYLKLARDDGYKDFLNAETDPAFAKVIKDPRVREVLQKPPAYSDEARKSNPN